MEDLSTVGLESEEAVKKWKKEEREIAKGLLERSGNYWLSLGMRVVISVFAKTISHSDIECQAQESFRRFHDTAWRVYNVTSV
jgi:hypothetical protein